MFVARLKFPLQMGHAITLRALIMHRPRRIECVQPAGHRGEVRAITTLPSDQMITDG